MLPFLFLGCVKQPQKTTTATILIKTPKMKFYDKGFIIKYPNYTQVEILNSGTSILKLALYNDRICKSTFECQSNSSFNKEYLNKEYKDSFLKELFEKEDKKVVFRDKGNRVLIKIIKD